MAAMRGLTKDVMKVDAKDVLMVEKMVVSMV